MQKKGMAEGCMNASQKIIIIATCFFFSPLHGMEAVAVQSAAEVHGINEGTRIAKLFIDTLVLRWEYLGGLYDPKNENKSPSAVLTSLYPTIMAAEKFGKEHKNFMKHLASKHDLMVEKFPTDHFEDVSLGLIARHHFQSVAQVHAYASAALAVFNADPTQELTAKFFDDCKAEPIPVNELKFIRNFLIGEREVYKRMYTRLASIFLLPEVVAIEQEVDQEIRRLADFQQAQLPPGHSIAQYKETYLNSRQNCPPEVGNDDTTKKLANRGSLKGVKVAENLQKNLTQRSALLKQVAYMSSEMLLEEHKKLSARLTETENLHFDFLTSLLPLCDTLPIRDIVHLLLIYALEVLKPLRDQTMKDLENKYPQLSQQQLIMIKTELATYRKLFISLMDGRFDKVHTKSEVIKAFENLYTEWLASSKELNVMFARYFSSK